MKRIAPLVLLLALLLSCNKDSETRNVNPYLPDYSFSVSINTSLPQYALLRTPLNAVPVNIEGAGISGIIVMQISDTDYRAWETSCPNQYPTACSKMTPEGTRAKCSCENFTYSLFDGTGDGSYTMKMYRVEVLGDVLRIYN